MTRSLMLISILALVGAIAGQAEDAIPPRFNFDRYSAMLDRSPFAVATAVALPSATPDFAKDLYVANAARSPEGDMVTIASSSDQGFKKYLSTRQPVDGYSIASIEWSERVGATKVTISKDGNFATISFNEALLSQPLTNAPPAPRCAARFSEIQKRCPHPHRTPRHCVSRAERRIDIQGSRCPRKWSSRAKPNYRSAPGLATAPIVIRCIGFSIGSCRKQIVTTGVLFPRITINILVLPRIFWRFFI